MLPGGAKRHAVGDEGLAESSRTDRRRDRPRSAARPARPRRDHRDVPPGMGSDRPADRAHLSVAPLPGAIGAWSCHATTIDRLFVNQGHLKVVLFDGREESKTYRPRRRAARRRRAAGLPASFPPASGTVCRTSAASDALVINCPTQGLQLRGSRSLPPAVRLAGDPVHVDGERCGAAALRRAVRPYLARHKGHKEFFFVSFVPFVVTRLCDLKSAAMPTPYESAKLILQIFEMRREAVLREARVWFVRDFNPETIDDVKTALAGPHNRTCAWSSAIGTWPARSSRTTPSTARCSSTPTARSSPRSPRSSTCSPRFARSPVPTSPSTGEGGDVGAGHRGAAGDVASALPRDGGGSGSDVRRYVSRSRGCCSESRGCTIGSSGRPVMANLRPPPDEGRITATAETS